VNCQTYTGSGEEVAYPLIWQSLPVLDVAGAVDGSTILLWWRIYSSNGAFPKKGFAPLTLVADKDGVFTKQKYSVDSPPVDK